MFTFFGVGGGSKFSPFKIKRTVKITFLSLQNGTASLPCEKYLSEKTTMALPKVTYDALALEMWTHAPGRNGRRELRYPR